MQLENLGWNTELDAAWQQLVESIASASDGRRDTQAQVMRPGRVLRAVRGHVLIATADGSASATLTNRHWREGMDPVVGDWVAYAPDGRHQEPSSGGDHAVVELCALLPRRTEVARRAITGQEGASSRQVLAANLDTIFVVVALDGGRSSNARTIERYVTMVWESGAVPVLALNKADLCDDLDGALAEAGDAAVGVDIHGVSAATGSGVEQLRDYCGPGQTVAFLGPSGVGKSSLINQLLGSEVQLVRAERADDHRGRHTTTRAELLPLPSGGLLVDTPGLRVVKLWDDGTGVARTFEDIEALAGQCRFRDCAHEGEPGCAVAAAVADGTLDEERVAGYRKLLREVAYLERRRDARARHEQKLQGRRFAKQVAQVMQKKRRQ